jgi:hypothetical protein
LEILPLSRKDQAAHLQSANWFVEQGSSGYVFNAVSSSKMPFLHRYGQQQKRADIY